MPLTIYDADRRRARWAASRLRARGRRIARVVHGEDWLRAGPTATGPTRHRLWQPHGLLVEAVELARQSPTPTGRRRALDIACGNGRDAVFLAMSGLVAEAWDVLPDAIDLCQGLARRHGVSVAARCRDVEADPTIEREHYDLVSCFNFLHRPLMGQIAAAVRPGGLVVYDTFVEPQRALYGRPRRDTHLLKSGELPTWFDGWEVLVWREGLNGPGRFSASLIARKPTPGR